MHESAVARRKACGIEDDRDYSYLGLYLLHDFKAAAQAVTVSALLAWGKYASPFPSSSASEVLTCVTFCKAVITIVNFIVSNCLHYHVHCF